MTKFFALPGLRVGYLMSQAKNIEQVRRHQEPWSCNALAQRAGIASLQDTAYIQKTISYVREARRALQDDLRRIAHLTVYDSQANFLLLRLHGSAPLSLSGLYEQLLSRGIMIRTCEDFNGLDGSFFRIAVRNKNDNRRLVAELRTILGSGQAGGSPA
jgi:histidinol-phosphate/aromatic aminotransferase/cobyric acid decarboxylase-like protein